MNSPALTTGEKMGRLLAAVDSRETARAYLDGLVEQGPVESMNLKDIPKITILTEDELTPEQRAELAGEREKLAAQGKRLILARFDGSDTLHVFEISAFPERLIPPQVREYLTDGDIQDFQDKMAYKDVELAAVRQKSEPK